MASAPHPFVARLRDARVRRGLTQAAVAERSGYEPSTIANYEAGRGAPGVTGLAAWSIALGFELALYEPPEPYRPPLGPELRPELAELMQQMIHLIATACGVSQREDDDE